MNITQRGIITLMKSAVTEQALALPEGFDLATAYSVFKPHHMSTLMYDGAVRCGISRSEPIMQKLFGQYCHVLMISERQMAEVQRVFAAFEAAGIDYMPLKGCIMKARYPKPELRIMGDADILIRVEQYDKIAPVMEDLGFADCGGSDHELVWKSAGLYLELHKRLIPSATADFYRYFGTGWSRAVNAGGTRYEMRAEDEMIYQFVHYAKHMRNGGIGCRHVLDLWVYRRSHPQLNEAYIEAELEKLQVLEFYRHTLRLISVWFEDGASDAVTELLTEYIFGSGSWGTAESKAASEVVRTTKRGRGTVGNKLSYLRSVIFVGREMLREKYTVLNKAPWLLPAVWVYRVFYKLLIERDTLKSHEEKLRTITEDGVEKQREFLHQIGLDFRF